MKDIILKITGKTLSMNPKPPEGEDLDDIEFVTEGKLSKRGNITFLSYEESQLSGLEGCKTTMTITPGKIKMKRSGGVLSADTVMVFEKGKRCNGLYETPYGAIDMEILADKIGGLETIEEGRQKLSVEYTLSLKNLFEAKKLITVEVNELS